MINTDCVKVKKQVWGHVEDLLLWKVCDQIKIQVSNQVEIQVRNEVCWQMEWEARMKVWRKVFE